MAPSWYAQNDSSREAVIFESFCRSDPAAELRGVGEGLQPGLDLASVELLERRHRHVHLAPNFEHRGPPPPALGPREPLGHRGDGGDIGGDVVPRDPVAAGGGLHQTTVLVDQGHGQPVDLELAHEGGRGRLRRDAPHAIEPCMELVDAEGVVEAHHRRPVLDRREQRRRCPCHPAGGRVGGHQLGMGVLEQSQLTDEGVVVGVGDLGGVELVVAVVVVRDQAAELLHPLRDATRLARAVRHARERTGRRYRTVEGATTAATTRSAVTAATTGSAATVPAATAAPTTASGSAAS